MEELKITVDQMKNYIGTGLILEYSGFGEDKKKLVDRWSMSIQEHWDIHFMNEGYVFDDDVLFYFKPIMYRLSDLDKEIDHNGERFVPLEKLKGVDGEYSIIQDSEGEIYFDDNCSLGIFEVTRCYTLVQKLFEWHFWPFGDEYFEKGLVIDKMKQIHHA